MSLLHVNYYSKIYVKIKKLCVTIVHDIGILPEALGGLNTHIDVFC